MEPNKSGGRHWLTGILALGLFGIANFYPAFISAALWLMDTHGHDHQIVVRADGNHFDILLSHANDGKTTAPHHEKSLGLVAAIFATHDHEGDVHVLHFLTSDAGDQMRSRAGLNPGLPQQWVWLAGGLTPTVTSIPTAAPAVAARPPPEVAADLLGLRTTVLLI